MLVFTIKAVFYPVFVVSKGLKAGYPLMILLLVLHQLLRVRYLKHGTCHKVF